MPAAKSLPILDAAVRHTEWGTPYLCEPGVALLALPATDLRGLAGFLGGFAPDLGFAGYLEDPTPLPPAEGLCKAAGQLCYASFGPKRTPNRDAKRYLDNILASGHGSVLEHASFTLLLYGVSRSLTHELVRHRAGTAFCLAGDTLIHSEHRDAGRPHGTEKRSIAELYAQQETAHGRTRLHRLRLRCLDEETGAFTVGRIKQVTFSGHHPVFKVTLDDGKTITCTKWHRFLTPSGWLTLDSVVGGLAVAPGGRASYGVLATSVLTDGLPAYQDDSRLRGRYRDDGLSQEAIAALGGGNSRCTRAWVQRRRWHQPLAARTVGGEPRDPGRSDRAGWPHTPPGRARLSERLTAAGHLRWRAAGPPAAVETSGDAAPRRPLVYGRDPYSVQQPRRTSRLLVPRPRKIIAVEYVGVRPSYDIEMDGNNHNFVANGIVVHNSQLSQRYVSGRVLRFVERPEFQGDQQLHRLFCDRIDAAAAAYGTLTELLLARQQEGEPLLSAEARTDLRKKVQQCSRSLLPNETEAPLVMTANARAWRHIIEMRAGPHAEVEIRAAALRIYRVLREAAPLLFGDYREHPLPDGTLAVETPHPKV